jgi:glycosyltransferase involved in cell wall biosynthesis
MRVAVIGARGIPGVEGGAEKNAEMLFPLVAQKHQVTLFSIRRYTKSGTYKGVKIISAPHLFLLRTDKLPCYVMAAIWSVFKRPDLIHCQGLGSALFLPFYKLTARRVVVRYGSADYDMKKWSWIGRLGFRISEWQLRFADAVIAVTPALKTRLNEHGINVRIEVIPNALDPMEPQPEADAKALSEHGLSKGRYVLGIGRVTAQKDFKTLIRAFNAYREQADSPINKLVIAGGGDGSGYLEEALQEAGPDVIFTDRLPRDSVHALLRNCGLYVSSSVHEGMSNAILEAISARAPVLLSDIPENMDLPVPHHHFFKTGDPASLTRLMQEATQQPRDFIADTAPFVTWQQVAAQTLELYASLMPEPQPAGRETAI